MKDIVIDNSVMYLFDKPKEECHKLLFNWIKEIGILTVSNKLIAEYYRTQGGCGDISGLLSVLMREGRFNKVSNAKINAFKQDSKFKYRCNYLDIDHARLTFLSVRKKLVSEDDLLISDINRFSVVDGIQPRAEKQPAPGFYE